MWKNEIKARRFQVHNQQYIDVMDEQERQYGADEGLDGADMYDDMYYYDQYDGMGVDAAQELEGLDPQQRAEYIQAMHAMAAAQGAEDFDSDDDAGFFDNNDLANRIWEDNEQLQDG